MKNQCYDCAAKPGEFHKAGCDIERCPRCGGQAISCDCIYELCGMSPQTLEEECPDVFAKGPTSEMLARWDAEWGARRMPWTGEWPGVAECLEFEWYSKWVEGRGWVRCEATDPGAGADLNRLASCAVWNPEQQRFVLPPDPSTEMPDKEEQWKG